MEFYNEGGIATFKKGGQDERKKKRQMTEAKRRYDAGDRSSYVMKKYGNTQKETPYEKKYKNLTKAQKQKNYQKTGSETGFDPYKRSNTIEYRDNEKMDARDRYLANQAYQKQQDVNQFLDKREALREHMAGRVMGGDPTLDKKEFQKKIKGYTDGVLGLNIGAKYADPVWDPVKRQYVRDKLRLGLGSNDYFDYMQRLQNLNPKKMDTINPWGSGATARKMITKGFGAPKYGIDQLGKGYNWLKENTGEAGQMIDDIDSIPKNILMKMGILTPTDDKLMEINKNLKGDVNETIEEVINPKAATNLEDVPPDWLTTRPDEIDVNASPEQIENWASKWNQQPGFDENYEIQYDPTQVTMQEKIDHLQKKYPDFNIAAMDRGTIDTAYKKSLMNQEERNRIEIENVNRQEAFNREQRDPGIIDYTQISPDAASTVITGDPVRIDELRENILDAPVGSETTEYDNAFIRSKLGFRQPNTVVDSSEFDAGGKFNVDTIFDSSAYDGLTEDQKIKLKEGINTPISSTWNQTYAPFADGGYLEKYDDGGYANMSTFEKLKAINDSIADG